MLLILSLDGVDADTGVFGTRAEEEHVVATVGRHVGGDRLAAEERTLAHPIGVVGGSLRFDPDDGGLAAIDLQNLADELSCHGVRRLVKELLHLVPPRVIELMRDVKVL